MDAGGGADYNAVVVQQDVNLTHHFLIAMPAMVDPNFSGAVVYICDHSERGALGLVINRPTELTLESLFDRIDQLGYDGWIGCEYKPAAGTREGLGWIKALAG